MNEKEDIYKRLSIIIRDVDENNLVIEASELYGKNLSTDLNLDSLDIVGLLLAIEEEFNSSLSDDEIEDNNLLQIDALVNYLYEN